MNGIIQSYSNPGEGTEICCSCTFLICIMITLCHTATNQFMKCWVECGTYSRGWKHVTEHDVKLSGDYRRCSFPCVGRHTKKMFTRKKANNSDFFVLVLGTVCAFSVLGTNSHLLTSIPHHCAWSYTFCSEFLKKNVIQQSSYCTLCLAVIFCLRCLCVKI